MKKISVLYLVALLSITSFVEAGGLDEQDKFPSTIRNHHTQTDEMASENQEGSGADCVYLGSWEEDDTMSVYDEAREIIPLSQKDNEVELFYSLMLRAHQGSATDQNNIGYRYRNGKGVERNDIEAARYFKLAADQGHKKALYNLGILFALGEGVPKDIKQAIHYYARAAEKGHSSSLNNLGCIYKNGTEGVPQNIGEAVRFFRLAAKKKHTKALFNLGRLYRDGAEGIPQDIDEAIFCFRCAAEKGHTRAKESLEHLGPRTKQVNEGI